MSSKCVAAGVGAETGRDEYNDVVVPDGSKSYLAAFTHGTTLGQRHHRAPRAARREALPAQVRRAALIGLELGDGQVGLACAIGFAAPR